MTNSVFFQTKVTFNKSFRKIPYLFVNCGWFQQIHPGKRMSTKKGPFQKEMNHVNQPLFFKHTFVSFQGNELQRFFPNGGSTARHIFLRVGETQRRQRRRHARRDGDKDLKANQVQLGPQRNTWHMLGDITTIS